MEVIDAVCDYKNFNKQELGIVKSDKAKERGCFKKRIILEDVKK